MHTGVHGTHMNQIGRGKKERVGFWALVFRARHIRVPFPVFLLFQVGVLFFFFFTCIYILVVIYIPGGKSGWFGGSVLRDRLAYRASGFH